MLLTTSKAFLIFFTSMRNLRPPAHGCCAFGQTTTNTGLRVRKIKLNFAIFKNAKSFKDNNNNLFNRFLNFYI